MRDVARDYDEIWSGRGGALMLVRRVPAGAEGKAHTLMVSLQPAQDGSAWEVVTAGDYRRNFPAGAGRQLLWQRERANIPPGGTGSQGPIGGTPGSEAGTGSASAGDQSSATDIGAGADESQAQATAAADNPNQPLVAGGDRSATGGREGDAGLSAAPARGQEGGADEVTGKAAAPPPVQLVAKDGAAAPLPTEGAQLRVAPEIRAQATDYLNGVTGDNPVQASLARIADPKVMDEAIQGVASFIPRDQVKPDAVLRQAAYATAMQPEDVLAALKGRLPDDTQMAAWAMLVNSGARELGALAQKAVETGAPEDWEAAVRAFALQNHILRQWTEAGTEMGRAFRARQLASEARSDYAQTVQESVRPLDVLRLGRVLSSARLICFA